MAINQKVRVWHDQYGVVDTLDRRAVVLNDLSTLATYSDGGYRLTVEACNIQWPDGYQLENPSRCYVVQMIDTTKGVVGDYQVFGTIPEATQCAFSMIYDHYAK